MNLVEKYFKTATEAISFCEYDNKDALADYNRKVVEMRRIAAKIESECPDLKIEFCKLLLNDNQLIRLWTAHHVLEVMNCDKLCRKTALKEIRDVAKTDKSANGCGEKIWLSEWYKTHPKDRWI